MRSKINFSIQLLLIPLLVFIAVRECKLAISLKQWEEAAYLSLTNKYDQSQDIYTEVYPVLKNDGRFLFNYGVELAVQGKYVESVRTLERAKKFISSSGLYIYLANDYEVLGEFEKAEYHYKHAIKIVPSKFRSKEYLLQLYVSNNKKEKAKVLAREIIDYPAKVPSNEVNDIKAFAHKILADYNSL